MTLVSVSPGPDSSLGAVIARILMVPALDRGVAGDILRARRTVLQLGRRRGVFSVSA
jgi:hypothetical protein